MAITRKGRFFDAVTRNDIAKVRKFLDEGFPVEYATFGGRNALLIAVIEGHREMAEMLIDRGANFARYYYHDLIPGGTRHETLLHVAAELGHKDIVDMLLERDKYDRALIDKPDSDRNTALHLAAARGHADIVRILLDHGFSPQVKGANGKTPMGYAYQGHYQNVVDMLAAATAKPESPAPEKPRPREEWKLLSAKSVAHVTEMPEVGYRMTDVFNFASHERLRIVNNLKTRADSVETTPFAAMADRAALEEALEALKRLGGAKDVVLPERPVARALRPPETPK
jgi:ankyrin repeat protein